MSGTNIFKKNKNFMFLYVKIFIVLLYYCLMSISANCLSRFLPLAQSWPCYQRDGFSEVSGHFWQKIVMLLLCKLKLDDHRTFQHNNDPNMHPNLPKLARSPVLHPSENIWWELKKALAQKPTDISDLEEERSKIPAESHKQCLLEVIKSKRFSTKYWPLGVE